MRRRLPALVLAALCVTEASAAVFRITDRRYGNAPQAEIDQLFNGLEAEINANIPDIDPSTYTKGVANATILAGAGVGADYVTPFSIALLGLTGGLAIDPGGSSLTEIFEGGGSGLSKVAGFGVQGAILTGLNLEALAKGKKLGFLDFSRLRAFLSINSESFGKTGDEVSGSFRTYSFKGQYKLVSPGGVGVRWGGVDLTTGLQYAGLRALVSKTLQQSTTQQISAPGNPSVTADFTGTVNLGADLSLWNLPVEMSTSVRVLSVLSFYGGAGLDLSLGSAGNISNLSGPISVTDSSGLLGDIGGQASLPFDSNSGPTPLSLRYFFGGQMEIGVVALSVQINGSATNGTLGFSGGLKGFW
jgi:hypothetical protein